MDRLSSAKKVVGLKQTKNEVVLGNAAVVYVAYDADAFLIKELLDLCQQYGADVVSEYSRKDISKACKIDVPCAAAAVLKD